MGIPGYQTPAETPDRVQPQTLTTATTLLISTVDRLVSAAHIQIAEADRDTVIAQIRSGHVTLVEALPEDIYAQGHLPGAVNVRPRRTAELAPTLLPDPAAPIVVYCGDASCDASLRVARYLTQLGYTNVRRYTGGKQDWTEAGLPLE
jgi:rhodanese-related sulfurtransferase